jgi:hypothetical protein
MKEIVDELTGAIERAVTAGLLSENDGRVVTEYTERLYRELYQEYDEFREVDDMLKGRILTYSEEVREKAWVDGIGIGEARGEARGKAEGKEEKAFEIARNFLSMGLPVEQVVKGTGLPIEKIQNLISLS